jgi:hypothetical protein
MKINIVILSIVISLILIASSTVSASNSGAYIGGGLNHLELDGDDSINMSITTGYNFHQWNFASMNIQALTLGIEAQYSDSISGTDGVRNHSVFAVLRTHISEPWYLKIKHGYTDFSNVALKGLGVENSHIGGGIGLGYQMNLGSIEIEYIYPNKTIHASIIEVSYKYHF